jgi:hypothetical protein
VPSGEGVVIRIPPRQSNIDMAPPQEHQRLQNISGGSDPMSISSAGNNILPGNSQFLPSNEDLGRFVTQLNRFFQEDRAEHCQWQDAVVAKMHGVRRAMRKLTAEVTARLPAPQNILSERAEESRRWWQQEAGSSYTSRSSHRQCKERK